MDFLQSYHLNHHHKNIQKHLYNYTFALLNELKFIMDSSAIKGGNVRLVFLFQKNMLNIIIENIYKHLFATNSLNTSIALKESFSVFNFLFFRSFFGNSIGLTIAQLELVGCSGKYLNEPSREEIC